jgi:hypothetical protein
MDENIATELLVLGALAVCLVGSVIYMLFRAWENKKLAELYEREHRHGP